MKPKIERAKGHISRWSYQLATHLEDFLRTRQALELAQARLRAKFVPQHRGRGRPPLEIDPVAVYLMARDGHSARDIARHLVCDPGTIRRRFCPLLQAAREYRARWAWLDIDPTLEWLQRGGWPGSPPPKLLSPVSRADQRRTQQRRRPGRPQLAINKDHVLELLLAGYALRGIAREVGCSVRTLARRFPDLVAGQLDPGFLNRMIFKSAVEEGNLPALLLLARRLVGQERRRAEREEEATIQRGIRGEL